jgi:adenylate cyclase
MTRDHRRLAAIVSADAVQYSRLMGLDESGTLAGLKVHRRELIDPKISEYGGRIVKTTGDGLLLEFPSVVDAVRCAVDVQRSMAERNAGVSPEQRIDLRIGINVGDIIIDGDDIFGDGVNVAARLQMLAEPGGICVSRVVRDPVLDKLSFAFEDLGAQEVKNIARPVEAYRVDLGTEPLRTRSRGHMCWQHLKRALSWRRLAGGVVALSLAGIGVAALPKFWESAPRSTAPALSVAILPFGAPPDGPINEQFADAFTEDVTMALGRNLRSALVSSHSVTLKYKGKPIDARTVGRDLNVRYLVEGEMRHAGDGVAVNAQLIDTNNAVQVWSDRLEVGAAQVAQDKGALAVQLTQRLGVALVNAERRRIGTKETAGQSPMELVLRATNVLDTGGGSLKAALEARKLCDRALLLDPNLLMALVVRGDTLEIQRELDRHANNDRLLQEEDEVSKRAVAVARDVPGAWQFRTHALIVQGRLEAALDANDEAVRLDATGGSALLQRAWLMILMGEPAETLPLVDKAIALNANAGRESGVAEFYRCAALLGLGRYDDAAAACRRSVAQNDQWLTHLVLVAAYAQNGDAIRTTLERARLLIQRPGFTIADLKGLDRNVGTPAYFQLADAHLYTGLRKAGIPEN